MRTLGRIAAAGIATVAGLLMACNGGGSSDSNSGSGGSTGTVTPSFFTYRDGPTLAFGNPTFVAPAGASTAGAVQVAATQAFTELVDPIVTTPAGAASSFRHAGLFELAKLSSTASGQSFYRVDFSQTPATPVQVSSDAPQTTCPASPGYPVDIAPTVIFRKLTDATTSFLLYSDPGTDGACGTFDDVTKVVNWGGTATTAGISLPGFPIGAIYKSDGTLGGLVVYQFNATTGIGSLLFLADFTSFATTTTLATNVGVQSGVLQPRVFAQGASQVQPSFAHGSQFFALIENMSTGTNELHRIDASGNYSGSLYSFHPNTSTPLPFSFALDTTAVTDASSIYIAEQYLVLDPTTNTANQYTDWIEAPLDGSAPATMRKTFANDAIFPVGVTTHNVVVFDFHFANAYGLLVKHPTSTTTDVAFAETSAPEYITPIAICFTTGSPTSPVAVVTDENDQLIGSVPMGTFVGSLSAPDPTAGIQPETTITDLLLTIAASTSLDPGFGIDYTNATLTDVTVGHGGFSFTTMSGSPLSLTFRTIAAAFDVHVPLDIWNIGTTGTPGSDLLSVDFTKRVATQITHSPSEYKQALN